MHAEALREDIAEVLTGMGLRLSPEKTLITHIDDGLDFLGWRIQRHRKRGTNKWYVYTYPARKAVKAVTAKVKAICRQDVKPAAGSPDTPFERGASGLVCLLSARCIRRRLPLPQPVHLATGHGMDTSQTPPDHLERDPPPLLRRWMVADHGRRDPVQSRQANANALPLSGNSDPNPLDDHGMTDLPGQ